MTYSDARSRPTGVEGDGPGVYAVEPDRLREFARQVDAQVQAIRLHRNALADLEPAAGGPVLMGDFHEALSFAATHEQAIEHVVALVAQLEDLLSYTDRVAVDVADGYDGVHAEASAAFGSASHLTGRPA
ncbi:MAG: hypothetical protein ACRCYR_11495 [Phycicoccus sp.]